MDTIDLQRDGTLDNLDVHKATLELDRVKRRRGDSPAEYTGVITLRDGEKYNVTITGTVTVAERPDWQD